MYVGIPCTRVYVCIFIFCCPLVIVKIICAEINFIATLYFDVKMALSCKSQLWT